MRPLVRSRPSPEHSDSFFLWTSPAHTELALEARVQAKSRLVEFRAPSHMQSLSTASSRMRRDPFFFELLLGERRESLAARAHVCFVSLRLVGGFVSAHSADAVTQDPSYQLHGCVNALCFDLLLPPGSFATLSSSDLKQFLHRAANMASLKIQCRHNPLDWLFSSWQHASPRHAPQPTAPLTPRRV